MSEPASRGPSADELRRSISEATDRIHAIIDSAEQAALEIRAAAVAEGERHLAEKRAEAEQRSASGRAALEALVTVLRASAERLGSESKLIADELASTVATLRDSAAILAPVDGTHPPQPGDPAPSPPPAAGVAADEPAVADEEPAVADDTAARERAGGDDQVEALLRATQMAVKGASREEIEQLLRAEYGLSDPRPLLDEILGR